MPGVRDQLGEAVALDEFEVEGLEGQQLGAEGDGLRPGVVLAHDAAEVVPRQMRLREGGHLDHLLSLLLSRLDPHVLQVVQQVRRVHHPVVVRIDRAEHLVYLLKLFLRD